MCDIGPNAKKCMHLEHEYGCDNYHPLEVVIESGKGMELTDVDGKKYLDFLAAYGAVNQGHCHPKIVKAIQEQASKLTLVSRAFHNNLLGKTEEYLAKLFKYDKVLLMNTGVEAGESSLKIARKWAYDVKKLAPNTARICLAKGNFWGRTLAACASSDDPERYTGFGPFNDWGFDLIEYDDLKELEEYLNKTPNCAAFMVEPIQGERGVYLPKEGYLKGVRDLCTKHNVLWICDEIQAGLGRSGDLLCHYHEKVRPDIVLLAKALSGGMLPVSAVLCDKVIMDVLTPGTHGSTYGGNNMACAAILAAMDVLVNEKLVENSKKMGALLLEKLKELIVQFPFIEGCRGRGLFCAIIFKEDSPYHAFKFCQALSKHGILAKPTHDNIVRLTPPLVVTETQIQFAIDAIKTTLKEGNFKK